MTYMRDNLHLKTSLSSPSLLPLNAPPKPSVSVRARPVDCLTEPGIVRFPVAQRPKRGPVFEEATGKRYEAREGVSTALARTGTEGGRTATVLPIPAREDDVRAERFAPENFLSVFPASAQRSAQAFRAGPGEGRRLSD